MITDGFCAWQSTICARKRSGIDLAQLLHYAHSLFYHSSSAPMRRVISPSLEKMPTTSVSCLISR